MTKHEAHKAFADADKAWGDELRRLFGKHAGDVRYQPEGKGEAGTELRRLHDARMATMTEWESAAGISTNPAPAA